MASILSLQRSEGVAGRQRRDDSEQEKEKEDE
jgi:hypothetical protein